MACGKKLKEGIGYCTDNIYIKSLCEECKKIDDALNVKEVEA